MSTTNESQRLKREADRIYADLRNAIEQGHFSQAADLLRDLERTSVEQANLYWREVAA